MGRAFIVIILGAAIFAGAAYHLGWFEQAISPGGQNAAAPVAKVPAEAELGPDLYVAKEFPSFKIPVRNSAEPIVLNGVMQPLEQEDVPGVVPGRILFIGIPVEDGAVLAAGSAAFLTEPYYVASVYAGRSTFVRFYKRLYEGATCEQGQVLAMIDPAEALGVVMEKTAKIAVAQADVLAAKAAEKEGIARWVRAKRLFDNKAMPEEEFGAAVLTKEKLIFERMSKEESVKLAWVEKDQADIKLRQHEIRALLPYKRFTVKSIARQTGYYIKQLEPTVMTVQNLARLQAEALVDEQYFNRLKQRKNITATIEPTILEEPIYEWPGHNRDVTSIAVTRDMKIVSASEDKTVCVWSRHVLASLRRFEHEEAVRVVACTPVGADKNLCIAGCDDGSIYVWNLDDAKNEPVKRILADKAHGSDTSITSLAVSADGKLFASGASNGTIRIWSTWATDNDGNEDYAKEKYTLSPETGVAQGHQDAVTSLHFTPQSRLVSAGNDKTLRVWKLKEKGAVADGRTIFNRGGTVTKPGVSQDGKWMLFDQGQMLKWLSVENHQLVHTLNVPQNATPFETFSLFSPDSTLILTAGANEGRLQLWKTPDATSRGFEVRQFATRERLPVACAAFSPDAGKADADGKPSPTSFAVSASGHKIYLWSIPTPQMVREHRITDVPMSLIDQNLVFGTKQTRVGFRVDNQIDRYPNGRFEAGRPVTIVID